MPYLEKFKKLRLKDIQIKILIVDDERMVAESLRKMLVKDYQVFTAFSVDEAEEVFDEKQPQIILTDQVMPQKKGMELLESIRKKDPNTIRIIMTGFKEIAELQQQMDSGSIYYYIHKPINVENLKNVIHRGALEYVSEVNRLRMLETIQLQNEELRQKNLELEELNKTKTEFLRNLSHRISTPLSGILAKSELMCLRKDFSKTQIEGGINSIYQYSLTLSKIIQNLLALGKLETGHFEFYYSVFSSEQLIRKATHGFDSFLKNKNLKLKIASDINIPSLLTDFDVLVLIMRNVLDNAIHYAKDNSAIRLSIKKKDKLLTVKVANKGPVIPQEEKEHLFAKFSSFYHEEDHIESAGLGLAVCKALLSQLNGDISYSSSETNGTVFKITLPVV